MQILTEIHVLIVFQGREHVCLYRPGKLRGPSYNYVRGHNLNTYEFAGGQIRVITGLDAYSLCFKVFDIALSLPKKKCVLIT